MEIRVKLDRIKTVIDNLEQSMNRWYTQEQSYKDRAKTETDKWEIQLSYKMAMLCHDRAEGIKQSIDELKMEFPELIELEPEPETE